MEVYVKKCNNCPFKAENYHEYGIGNDTVLYCNLKAYLGLKTTYLTSYGAGGSCEHCNQAMDDSLITGEDFENYFDEDLCTCGETPDVPIPDDCPIRSADIKISTNDNGKENIIPDFNSPKNWEEDYQYESGNYINKCTQCKEMFFGHKKRHICKECVNKKTDISLFT